MDYIKKLEECFEIELHYLAVGLHKENDPRRRSNIAWYSDNFFSDYERKNTNRQGKECRKLVKNRYRKNHLRNEEQRRGGC